MKPKCGVNLKQKQQLTCSVVCLRLRAACAGGLSQKPVLYPSLKSLRKKGFTAIYTEPDKNDDMSELLSLMPLLVFKVRGKIQGNSFPLVLLLPLDLHSQVEQ